MPFTVSGRRPCDQADDPTTGVETHAQAVGPVDLRDAPPTRTRLRTCSSMRAQDGATRVRECSRPRGLPLPELAPDMRMASILSAIVALAGCRRDPGRVEDVTPPAAPVSMVGPVVVDRYGLPVVVRASNAFAMERYRRIRERPGNLLAAPAATSAGLATRLAGARDAGRDGPSGRPGAATPAVLTDFAPAYASMIQEPNAAHGSSQVRLAGTL